MNKELRNKEATYKLNLNLLTWDATKALMDLDDSYVGTKNYMGITYFWASDYKFYLRHQTIAQRRKIHHALLKAGLEVDKVSSEHEAIIKRFYKEDKSLI
jgi:hypothetical protein